MTPITEQEYKDRMKKIEADYEAAKRQLYIDYALSHAKFKVGDIIKDHRWAIKVDKITVYIGFGLPEPVYHGIELKKDLTPAKKNLRQAIYGNDGVELVKAAE